VKQGQENLTPDIDAWSLRKAKIPCVGCVTVRELFIPSELSLACGGNKRKYVKVSLVHPTDMFLDTTLTAV